MKKKEQNHKYEKRISLLERFVREQHAHNQSIDNIVREQRVTNRRMDKFMIDSEKRFRLMDQRMDKFMIDSEKRFRSFYHLIINLQKKIEN